MNEKHPFLKLILAFIRVWGFYIAIMLTIASFLPIINGISYLYLNVITVNAKILEIDNDIPKCLLDTDVNNFVCKLKIEYEYNNSKYVKLVEYIGNTQYNKGDIIKIQFSAKDPSFIVLNMEYSKVSKPKGYFLIFLGIFFIMVIWKLYHIFKNEVK